MSSSLSLRPVTVARLAAVAALSWAPAAIAQQSNPDAAPSVTPIRLRIDATPDSYAWSFALENTGPAPLSVVVDRRLLSLEVQPATDTAQPTRARGRRAPRTTRCTQGAGLNDIERSPTRRIAPGERVREGFDLRSLCGLRMPAAVTPGATVVFHYGFAGRPAAHRAIVLDEAPTFVSELVSDPLTIGTLERTPLEAPDRPSSAASTGAPPANGRALSGPADTRPAGDREETQPVRLRITGTFDAPDARGMNLAYTLRNETRFPVRVFHRPGMVRVRVRDPLGRVFECYAGPREYPFMREFVVRLGARQSVRGTLSLGSLCERERLALPGIYEATAIFAASQADPGALGERAFTGTATSAPFFLRVRVGQREARYVPLPARSEHEAGQGAPTATHSGHGDEPRPGS